jgi:hypothetical protein
MVVNLDEQTPRRLAAAARGSYPTRTWHALRWALEHGGVGLRLHAGLGLALVLLAVAAAVAAVRSRRPEWGIGALIALLVILGGAITGAAFLAYGHRSGDSLAMALALPAAALAYALAGLIGGGLRRR